MAEVKDAHAHVEVLEDDIRGQKVAAPGYEVEVMGTVKLTEGDIVYVPRPTADPQDPLNMPMWQKYVVLVMLSTCELVPCFLGDVDTDETQVSTLGLSLVSGLGGLLGYYIPEYEAQGYGFADITALMTYPALFM